MYDLFRRQNNCAGLGLFRMKVRLLLVEDEPTLRGLLADRLEHEGFSVTTCGDGLEAADSALRPEYDIIILDVGLPGCDGFEVCRRLRQSGSVTPVLMLTARGNVHDRVAGLRIGADDYLPKPFDVSELLARLDALLRRRSVTAPAYDFSDVHVDPVRKTVTRGGSVVDLAVKEFQLLCYLLERPDTPVSRDELLREVWGYDKTPSTRTVDVHMAQLRQKLEKSPKEPKHFVTAHGWGYKFVKSL